MWGGGGGVTRYTLAQNLAYPPQFVSLLVLSTVGLIWGTWLGNYPTVLELTIAKAFSLFVVDVCVYRSCKLHHYLTIYM